jgi:hypothetical protein
MVLALLLSVLASPIAGAADTCAPLNVPSLADDNLTITLISMTKTEKTGSFQLTISYKMLNGTSDKKIDEGSFKIFYTDGTSEPQYGFFGTFFPGDSKERSYTWEYLKSKTPMNVSYNAGFFSSAPSSLKLNWAPPGQACNLVSPAAKAAAEKAAADAKAAAEKAAADAKAIADKAAADAKAAAEKAAADAKAIADKAAADAKAAAEKAAADAKAIADKAAADAKAIADKAAADAKAAAEANRKEQLISANPLRTGVVPLSSSGLPIQVKSTSNLSVFAYNSTNDVCVYENGMIKTKTSGRCVIAFSQEGNFEYKPATNLILDFTISAANKKTTITCIKGKLVKKVTAVKPVCPAGYKKK